MLVTDVVCMDSEADSADTGMTLAGAQELVAELRGSLAENGSVSEQDVDLFTRLHEGRVWRLRGLASWKDFIEKESLAVPISDPDVRADIFEHFRNRNWSLRAIAPVMGVSHETAGVIARKRAVHGVQPGSKVIIGLDGKTYPLRRLAQQQPSAETVPFDSAAFLEAIGADPEGEPVMDALAEVELAVAACERSLNELLSVVRGGDSSLPDGFRFQMIRIRRRMVLLEGQTRNLAERAGAAV